MLRFSPFRAPMASASWLRSKVMNLIRQGMLFQPVETVYQGVSWPARYLGARTEGELYLGARDLVP
jgi:hypothetical protein